MLITKDGKFFQMPTKVYILCTQLPKKIALSVFLDKCHCCASIDELVDESDQMHFCCEQQLILCSMHNGVSFQFAGSYFAYHTVFVRQHFANNYHAQHIYRRKRTKKHH